MSAPTISPVALALLSILIPIGMIISAKLKLGLNRDIAISHTRMILQLSAVGFFLEWLFTLSGLLPSLLWFAVMTITAAFAILRSSGLRARLLIGPVGLAVATVALVHLLLFLLAAGPDLWNARGIIPLGGMLLGNTMTSIIIGLNEFFSGMRGQRSLYELRLGMGHNRLGAALPFIRSGIKRSLAPQLAAIATIGIVSLPGMMTGQILGGSSPITAVTYQIAIIVAIFSTRLIGSALVILTGLYFGTSPMGNLKNVFHPQEK